MDCKFLPYWCLTGSFLPTTSMDAHLYLNIGRKTVFKFQLFRQSHERSPRWGKYTKSVKRKPTEKRGRDFWLHAAGPPTTAWDTPRSHRQSTEAQCILQCIALAQVFSCWWGHKITKGLLPNAMGLHRVKNKIEKNNQKTKKETSCGGDSNKKKNPTKNTKK